MKKSNVIRRRIVQAVGFLFNFLLPWILYRVSVSHVGETNALILSAAAPAAWSLIELVRSRRVNLWSMLVLSGIAFGLTAMLVGGSPKLLLFRESLFTGLSGLALVVSGLLGRPLLYWVIVAMLRSAVDPGSTANPEHSRNRLASVIERLESVADEPWFIRTMTVSTIFVGLVGVGETVARGILIYTLPSDKVLLLLPVVRYSAAALIFAWAVLYVRPSARRAERDVAAADNGPIAEMQRGAG